MSRPIFWTRSKDDWIHDQKWLGADEQVYPLPMLEYTALPVAFPEKDPQLIFITSQKVLKYATNHQRLAELFQNKVPVLSFGEKTWLATRESGCHGIRIQAPDGREFVKKVLGIYPPLRAWYLTSETPAVPLDELLNQQGWRVQKIPLYQSGIGFSAEESTDILKIFTTKEVILCFASPATVHAFHDWAKKMSIMDRLQCTAVAIGSTTEAACRMVFNRCEVAEDTTIEALYQKAKSLASASSS